MKLATITNWAYGITVALTLASGTAMLLASDVHDRERDAVQQRHELDESISILKDEVYKLTGYAREFVINGDPGKLVVYRREVANLKNVENRIEHIGDAGASRDELNALAEAVQWADTLHGEQDAAIAAYRQGDTTTARQILFGAEYERELGRIESAIGRFQYRLDQRIGNKVENATRTSLLWRRISEAMLAITAILFLGVLYFILRRRILNPVIRLSDVVSRLAAQDYAVDMPRS